VKTSNNRGYSHKEDPAGRLAARQWGVLGRSQALEAGFSAADIEYRLRKGEWQRVLPAVYRMRGAPVGLEQRLMAATLWAGPEAAISHRAAAALWKLEGVEPGLVELTTTTRRTDVPKGLTLHRTTELARSDCGFLGPFRITGLVRTLVDLGAVADGSIVEAAMESALRRDPELLVRLGARLDALGARGRRGAGVLREILALRDPDAAPTEGMFETLVERLLRKAGIELPVRQYEVWVDGVLVARIDFAWVARRVGLEPVGYWCHSGRRRFQRGVDRANDLALTKWTIIYVTWEDLVLRPDEFLSKLQKALAG
jgi:hypothetical protein